MIIYIRHGDDQSEPQLPPVSLDHKYTCSRSRSRSDCGRRKRSVCAHDALLSVAGCRESERTARYLIRQFGHPSVVYCSPFERTRATAMCMARAFTRSVRIVVDPRLGRLFAPSEQRRPRMTRATRQYRPIVHESAAAFRRRVSAQLHDMICRGYHRTCGPVVWCITHAVPLKQIAREVGAPVPRYIQFMDCLVVSERPHAQGWV
jgi:broad specificity phosphatase PhoE